MDTQKRMYQFCDDLMYFMTDQLDQISSEGYIMSECKSLMPVCTIKIGARSLGIQLESDEESINDAISSVNIMVITGIIDGLKDRLDYLQHLSPQLEQEAQDACQINKSIERLKNMRDSIINKLNNPVSG